MSRLEGGSRGVRDRAATALGLVVGSGKAHLKPLVAAVADEYWVVRVGAIISLQNLVERGLHRQNSEVRRAIIAALADATANVRRAATSACRSLGPMASSDAPRP